MQPRKRLPLIGRLVDSVMHSGFPRQVSAVLLDCDGVLVDSAAASDQALLIWAKRTGLDASAVLNFSRGRRVPEIIASFIPAYKAEEEIAFFTQLEVEMALDVKACPGARQFVSILHPHSKWAVVTSAEGAVAKARLAAAGLPLPPVLVAGEDVSRGKPWPDCYLIAAQRLGVAPRHCLALDDLPIGVEAARRAGAVTVLVGSQSSMMPYVPSLAHVHLVPTEGRLRVDLEGVD